MSFPIPGQASDLNAAGADPGLAPDLAAADPDLPLATGQGDPTPPATTKAIGEAAALLSQVYWESYGSNGSDPVDGTADPYRS